VLKSGRSSGTVLNAANEVAVAAFLSRRLGFLAIARLVEATLEKAAHLATREAQNVDDVLAIDAEARNMANSLLSRFAEAEAAN
jgi:1-deoxy-D-xylulose-5-phosphate reductoisomerase